MNSSLVVKQAEFDDAKALNALVTDLGGGSLFKATFGTFNFANIIEKCFTSVVATSPLAATDADEQPVVGYLAVDDSLPHLSEPEALNRTIEALNIYIPVTSNNTLFIHFLMVNESIRSADNFGAEIMKKVFAIAPHVDFIVWICPKTYIPSDYIGNLFSKIKLDTSEQKTADLIDVLSGHQVLFLHRSNFLPKLLVREARVEDNDDLIPILQDSNPDILIGQDNFFLADLIQSQDTNNSFYVGLQRNVIVGMLATSLDVNVSLIMKIFDIEAFPDIVIKKAVRPPPPPLLIAVVGDLRTVDAGAVAEAVNALGCIFIDAEAMELSESADAEAEETKARAGDWKEQGTNDEECNAPSKSEASPLYDYIEGIVNKRQAEMGSEHAGSIPAVVLFGYPRSESEAAPDRVRGLDYIVELSNVAEDADEFEDDEALQQHLDALELFREQYYSAEGKHGGAGDTRHHQHHRGADGTHKAAWRKVSVDGEVESVSDNVPHLMADLQKIVEHRHAKIETQRAKDNEEPPEANAFAVTVFSLTSDFLSRGLDLLKFAFEQHPQLDYCLFMVPNNSPPPPELVRGLTYVKSRPGISFDQSLYVLQRSAFYVNEHLRVQRLSDQLLSSLQEYAGFLPQQEQAALMDGARAALEEGDVELYDNPQRAAFVVTIGETIVGAVQLSRKILTEDDVLWIRQNYHADELINFDRHRTRNQAVVTQWLLDPVYSSFTRRIVQLVMRTYGKSLLYYHAEADACPPKEVLEEFVPLRPRRRMQQQPQQGSGAGLRVELLERPSAEGGGLGVRCPLFCLSKHLLSRPKDTVTQRIVVAAGSSHSYALLETLCNVPYINFPNVYVIMNNIPPPFCTDRASGAAAGDLSSSATNEDSKHEDAYSGCFSVKDEQFPLEQELAAMGLAHKVNFVQGNLTDIDRDNRAVVVSDELVIEYDLLVLSTCTQDSSTRKIPSLSRMHPAKCADAGIFGLGNPVADQEARRFIHKRYPGRSEDVVVSGSGVQAFTAVEQLLSMGIAPARITVVVPEEEGKVAGIPEKKITDPIVKGLLSVGVKVCWGFGVSEVSFSRTGFVQSVDLQSAASTTLAPTSKASAHSSTASAATSIASGSLARGGVGGLGEDGNAVQPIPVVVVQCFAVLFCSQMQCDRDVFCAVNDSGLVFDGGLVVDTSFKTIDPSIYAVSDYTRFSRVYRNAVPHKRYNPKELGTFVALRILEEQLDPRASSRAGALGTAGSALGPDASFTASFGRTGCAGGGGGGGSSSSRPALPSFALSRCTSCRLPGGLHFFEGSMPQLPEETVPYFTDPALAMALAQAEVPRNRTTMLKCDNLGKLVQLMYVGVDVVETKNLGLVVGLHEAYLNSAVHSFKKGLVTDWVDFLRQPWAAAIYQEKFPMLVQALKRSLRDDKGMLMVVSRVFERAENAVDDSEVSSFRRDLTGPHGDRLPGETLQVVRDEAEGFLRAHSRVLPCYQLQQQAQGQGPARTPRAATPNHN